MTVTTPAMHNWPELLSSVEKNEGVFRASMATLRHLEGRQRAGKHIRTAIQEKLASMGLGHLPEELPNRQQNVVLLYKLGTPASEMVQAVKRGLTEPSPPESAYTLLHRLNTIPDPDDVVHREDVEETVNKEVGDAIEQTAHTVLAMLAQSHPQGSQETGGAGTIGQGRTVTDILTALQRADRPSPTEDYEEASH